MPSIRKDDRRPDARLRAVLEQLEWRDGVDHGLYQALSEALEAWVEGEQGENPIEWLSMHVPGRSDGERAAFDAALLAAQVDKLPGEALLLSSLGEILALNDAARVRFKCEPGNSIRGLGFSIERFQRQVTVLVDSGRALGLLVPQAVEREKSAQRMMVIGRTPFFDVFLLWRPCSTEQIPIAASFQEAFALSEREMVILSGLVSGASPESIASSSGRSVGTVRQQIKSVLAKLGVGSQAAAVALVGQVGHMSTACPALFVDPVQTDTVSHGVFSGAHGRVVGYRRWGAHSGVPVLVVHGALFGICELGIERELARQMGLMCFAMERPGYGRTTFPHQGDVQQFMLDDAIALLNHVGIKRCVVLAHDIGTFIAMRLAEQVPERIAAIVAAPATPPMEGWRQTAHMPASLRIHAWASQRFPRMTDILINLGMRHVRQSGFQSFPALVFKDCPHDLEVWIAPDRIYSAAGACALIAAQDARGFKYDMYLTNLDWRELASRVRIPVYLMHGSQSQTVCAQAVERLNQTIPISSLEVVDDAGHTLPLSHPALLLERVRAMADLHIGF